MEGHSVSAEAQPKLGNEAKLRFPGLSEEFDQFEMINWDPHSKMVSLVGRSSDLPDSHNPDKPKTQVLIKVEPLALPKASSDMVGLLHSSMSDSETNCKKVHDNDIFKKYRIQVSLPLVAEVVYPCPDKLVNKARASPSFLIEETAQVYESRTKPLFAAGQSGLGWVHNIINQLSEADHVLLRHEKFIVCKDYKQGADSAPEELHYLAIATDPWLMSIRDLEGTLDLDWLLEALQQVPEVISAAFSGRVKRSQIRAYFHYWPTFPRLHIHFSHVDSVNSGIECERARLLTDVIRSLQADKDFFKKATMTLKIKANDAAFSTYEDLIL